MSSESKKSLKNQLIFITYNVLVVLVVTGLSELAIEYLLKNPTSIPKQLVKPFRAYYAQHIRSAIQMEKSCSEYDPELFYKLKPGNCNFCNLEFNSTYSINSMGLRDDESSLENPAVILLGDSFTMGWGVNQDSTFEKHLERSTNLKILNAGISSYGTIRELTLFKKLLQKDDLQYLIIQYHESDLLENKNFKDNGNMLKISSEEVYEENVQRVRNRTKYFFGKHSALTLKFIAKNILGRLNDRRKTGREDALNFMNVLSNIGLPNNVQIIVFELSSYGETDHGFIENLSELITDHDNFNIIPIKVQPHLNSNHYFILDDHINSQGHKKVADVLAKTLESR